MQQRSLETRTHIMEAAMDLFERFDDAVFTASDDPQTVANVFDSLMTIRPHQGFLGVENLGQGIGRFDCDFMIFASISNSIFSAKQRLKDFNPDTIACVVHV